MARIKIPEKPKFEDGYYWLACPPVDSCPVLVINNKILTIRQGEIVELPPLKWYEGHRMTKRELGIGTASPSQDAVDS